MIAPTSNAGASKAAKGLVNVELTPMECAAIGHFTFTLARTMFAALGKGEFDPASAVHVTALRWAANPTAKARVGFIGSALLKKSLRGRTVTVKFHKAQARFIGDCALLELGVDAAQRATGAGTIALTMDSGARRLYVGAVKLRMAATRCRGRPPGGRRSFSAQQAVEALREWHTIARAADFCFVDPATMKRALRRARQIQRSSRLHTAGTKILAGTEISE